MRKAYKDQMDEIHLPPTLREKIVQDATTTVVKRKPMRKQLRVALSCVVLCVITGLILFMMQEDQHKEYRKNYVAMESKQVDDKGYKGIEGMPNADMAVTGSATSMQAILPMDLFEGKTLPIYEFDETNELEEIKTLASKLNVNWDDELLMGKNDMYQMEANAYGYYAVEDTQAYVDVSNEEQIEKYRIYLPLKNPMQECEEKVCFVYETGNNELETYINKALFRYEFHTVKAIDEEQYHTTLIGFDKSRIALVKKVDILTKKEAEESLLAGTYYSYSDKVANIVKADIQEVTLMYNTLGGANATYPYMLPIYQFIVRRDEMDYICNVVALKQEDLKDLEHSSGIYNKLR